MRQLGLFRQATAAAVVVVVVCALAPDGEDTTLLINHLCGSQVAEKRL